MCKVEKPLTEFNSNGYQPNGAKKYKAKCKPCQQTYDRTKFRNTIRDIVGSYSCKICGYSKCLEAIEFHHINPSIKEWKLSDLVTNKIERIILWGGVQMDNERAINYYKKIGFETIGQFTYNGENYDMIFLIPERKSFY